MRNRVKHAVAGQYTWNMLNVALPLLQFAIFHLLWRGRHVHRLCGDFYHLQLSVIQRGLLMRGGGPQRRYPTVTYTDLHQLTDLQSWVSRLCQFLHLGWTNQRRDLRLSQQVIISNADYLKWVFTGVSVVPVVGVARTTPQDDVQDEDGHSQDGADRDGDVERCKIAVLGFLEVGIAFVGVSVVKHWHLNTFGAFAAVTRKFECCCWWAWLQIDRGIKSNWAWANSVVRLVQNVYFF